MYCIFLAILYMIKATIRILSSRSRVHSSVYQCLICSLAPKPPTLIVVEFQTPQVQSQGGILEISFGLPVKSHQDEILATIWRLFIEPGYKNIKNISTTNLSGLWSIPGNKIGSYGNLKLKLHSIGQGLLSAPTSFSEAFFRGKV